MQINESKQCYSPELIDLLLPDDDLSSGSVKNIFIIMEASETDLKNLIDLGSKSGFNQEHLKIIIYNTLCSLKFLHSCNVVHRDIKPANILINQNC